MAIRLIDLEIGYHTAKSTKVIASGLNETINPGMLICLVGPNGAGKSTLLKTIGGFIPPIKGDVVFEEKRLKEMSPNEKARTIAVVLTQRSSYNQLTVKELVGLGRTPFTGFFGTLSDADNQAVDKAMDETGIAFLADRLVASLSDGERQKALIAKALAQNTPFILLDEPTAFLDYPSKVETMRLLSGLCKHQKKTILISTHDLDIAFAMTDIIWAMAKTKKLFTGTVERLAEMGIIDELFCTSGMKYDPSIRHFKINHFTS